MVCTCNIAGLFEVGYDGIISASITGSSEFINILSQCKIGPNIFTEVRKRLRGPATGTMNISAYAFEQGADRYLDTSCPSQAGISFQIQQRYDCENNVTYLIRTQTGDAAFREGDPITGITLFDEFCSFRTVNANASSGPGTVVTDTERFLGADLVWAGPPFSFDSRDADTLDFTILNLDVKLTNFNINAQVPTPATNQYTFSFSIPSCEGELI